LKVILALTKITFAHVAISSTSLYFKVEVSPMPGRMIGASFDHDGLIKIIGV
jgi:hypothetical protein